MAKIKDSKIERALKRVVREAVSNGQVVTVKQVKSKAEEDLGLEPGFLNDGDWKARSRVIVNETFQEEQEEDAPEQPSTTTPQPSVKTAKNGMEGAKSTQKQKKKQDVQSRDIGKAASLPNGHRSADEEEKVSDGDGGSESRPDSHAPLPAASSKAGQDPPQVNGVKRKSPAQSSSDSADSDDSESESEELPIEPVKKKARSSSRGNAEVVQDARKAKTTTSHPQTATQGEGHQSTTTAIPAQQYQPPPGFSVMKVSSLDHNNALSPASLEGKQIWHIVAPSSIDPASLSNLTVSALQSNHTEVTINGLDYAIDNDPFSSTKPAMIMLPTGEGYRPLAQKVERSLKLKQKIDLPNLGALQASQVTGSSAAADIAQPPVSSIRPQPKGLRMRYRPPGFGTGKLGAVGSGSESPDDDDNDDDDEEQEDGTSFQFPKALGGHAQSKRQTVDPGVRILDADAEATPHKSKKKKEKRKEKLGRESQVQAKEDDVEMRDYSLTPPSKVRRAMSQSPNPSHLKPTKFVTNGTPAEEAPQDDAKAEKARRKEEKRLKKERKEARREAKRKTKEDSQVG